MDTINHLIPDKEKKLIKDLEDLLDFTNSEMSNYEFKIVGTRIKYLFLYQSLGDLFTKVSAILSLLKESKTRSCNIILRTVIEALINIEYVFAIRADDNLLKLYLDDSYDKASLGNKVKDFFHRHPDFKPFGGEQDTKEFWENYSVSALKEVTTVKKIKRKPNLETLPNLKDRALQVDSIKKSNLEWWYINLYWLFSQDTHSTLRGLDSHFIYKDDQRYFELEGDISEIGRISILAYMVLYITLEKFFIKFKFDTNKLTKYKDTFNSYSKRSE